MVKLKLFTAFFSLLFITQIYAQDFITREGEKLKYKGQQFHLRGMSFGNLVWEDVLIPTGHHTKEDYTELKSLGMNCVRFYLNYKTLEDDNNPYFYKEAGWKWIDDNISWAKENNIFLMLNIHVPQGGYQSGCKGNPLWEEAENQKRLSAMWKAIAERYKNESTIAGYGILNEPIPTRSISQWSVLAQRTIDSIRRVDQNHLIVVERAIAINCNFNYNDGKYNYPEVSDQNLMYESHIYDPYEYTSQNLDWANTGDGGRYPDESVVGIPADILFAVGNFDNPRIQTGTSDWQYYEGTPFLVNADSLISGSVVFYSNGLSEGTVFFDDVLLVEVDDDGNVVKEIIKENLTSATLWYWSENGLGEKGGASIGHNDEYSVFLTGNAALSSVTIGNLSFKVEKGKRYKISGWMKGENVPAGGQAIITTNFYYSPSGGNVTVRNKEYLKERIVNYSQYVKELGYPMFFGEFGVARNAFENGKGGDVWVKDVIDIFDELDIHWTYHVFKEPSFGYYDGWDGPIDRTTLNVPLKNVFLQYFNIVASIQETEQTDILRIIPNPFSDLFEVGKIFKEDIVVKLYSVEGIEVWTDEFAANSKIVINPSVESGIYYLKASNQGKSIVEKIVKID